MTSKLIAAFGLMAGGVFGACSAPGVHSSAGNFATDLLGVQDTRPSTWGKTAVVINKITFKPPAGCRVRILRVYGDFTVSLHGLPPPGSSAWALWGLQTTAPEGSQYADYAADNTFLYVQVSDKTGRAPIDYDTHVGGLLGPDNVLVSKMAGFLNDAGQLHAEPSFVLVFQFE